MFFVASARDRMKNGCEDGNCFFNRGNAGHRNAEQTQTLSPRIANLTAQYHLTMADLLDAEAADKPNQKKINQLKRKLETLQEQLQDVAPAKRFGMGRGLFE